ncbi:16S rRNA (guanine(966)-N(2))-methyltransferase RsmD [Phytoactinopolyspora alkaliphila]|uniref:16S rRNA (Guanine(966)-N(2))-methyltransferase RsmD n=1 Tax=Phytoactinopolyspora alkaliphila TaxID=1783498 RepID=A0A6N9YPX7_9ACTN|nr:16S rRNA (guanine(966)-N(2))-methyltransferase RsmD [Phytoactinopolyspora alkaliphila]
MTRVVAGAARGRRLKVPPGTTTRPTADRVREAMFSSLESLLGGFSGIRVLDLYAGSGALGLEALSRGAAKVTLVESDARAVRVVRANVAAVGLPGAVVVHDRAERAAPGTDVYDLVVADPPYSVASADVSAILAGLAGRSLAPGAVVVVERDRRSEPLRWPEGVSGLRERRYGETVLWYGRAAGTS